LTNYSSFISNSANCGTTFRKGHLDVLTFCEIIHEHLLNPQQFNSLNSFYLFLYLAKSIKQRGC